MCVIELLKGRTETGQKAAVSGFGLIISLWKYIWAAWKEIWSVFVTSYHCLTCLESIANGAFRVMHFNNQLLSTLLSHRLPRVDLFNQETNCFTAHVKLLPVVYNGLIVDAR